jgi:hypothetical protein
MRTAYQYNHLSESAKIKAGKENKGVLLTTLLFNIDGSLFQSSTTVKAYKK